MALTVDTNSYIDAADADAYFADRFNSDGWTNATVEDKDLVLILATKMIDSKKYQGSRTDSTQSLAFPRYYLYIDGIELDTATVPQNVLDATCELAIYYLDNPSVTSSSPTASTSEYSSVKVGSIEVEYPDAGSANVDSVDEFPVIVDSLLAFAKASSSRMYLG